MYAVTVAGEGGRLPFAAVGHLAFDGSDLVTGAFTENRPGARFDERSISETSYRARYSMANNGLGTLMPEATDSIEGYFAVREASGDPSAPVVQEVALIFRDLDPATGSLRTAVGRRLPNNAAFSNASLQGLYTGFAIGRGGQMPMAGFGVVTYDGAGGFSEANAANVQGDTIGSRRFVQGTDQGRYMVTADGTGTLADGGMLFVITRATVIAGIVRADEYSFMVRNVVPINGAHFTGVARRISD
jgi:hypothetical protein